MNRCESSSQLFLVRRIFKPKCFRLLLFFYYLRIIVVASKLQHLFVDSCKGWKSFLRRQIELLN